ncbi:MAG: (deoxy)nucleoside triphosphate pyrophosphohydrolase [Bacteroidales bacterium]|nr:(deoxy)nucleoside triphosphate pyrophosphohydrolase [Bacteroidales bacterium]
MINVTCAIIRNEEDEVLVVQRGEATDHPLKWEFPGGKLHGGESREDCIIREVEEELSMEVVIVDRLPEVEYDYGFKQIRLIPFICDTLDELPFLSEHIAYKWISSNELTGTDFSEADIVVAQNYLEIITIHSKDPVKNQDNPADNLSVDKELRAMVNSMMSMKEAEWVAVSAIENPEIFSKLLEYSFSEDSKLAFRASWTLTKVCDRFPELIYPEIDGIIQKLGALENESALRSFLRIISLSDIERISEKNHGILADQCFRLLRSGFSAVAIKAYSMEVLYKLVLKYPELRNELSATINMIQPEGSAGILSRGRQILKKLAGL